MSGMVKFGLAGLFIVLAVVAIFLIFKSGGKAILPTAQEKEECEADLQENGKLNVGQCNIKV